MKEENTLDRLVVDYVKKHQVVKELNRAKT